MATREKKESHAQAVADSERIHFAVKTIEQVSGICMQVMLDWGRAIRVAEKDPKNEAAKLHAKLLGMRAIELAEKLAERFPE